MSSQPSFRLPFSFPEEVHPTVQNAIRAAFNGLADLNQAIKTLVPKVNSHGTSITNITENISGSAGGFAAPSTIGTVNLQPNLTPGTYTTQQSDYGSLVVVQSGIPFTWVLNSNLVSPFFAALQNLGSGTVTLSPSTGTVNNVALLTVPSNQMIVVYFDGRNWWALYPLLAQTLAKITHQWLDSYNALTGLYTQSQPAAADLSDTPTAGNVLRGNGAAFVSAVLAAIDLSNGVTGSGAVVLATAPTVVSPVTVTGLQIFANNAAAITGGLAVGNLYRTGADPDLVAVVH